VSHKSDPPKIPSNEDDATYKPKENRSNEEGYGEHDEWCKDCEEETHRETQPGRKRKAESQPCHFENPKRRNNLDKIVKDLKAKYEAMAKKMEGRQSLVDGLLQHTSLPFTAKVMKFPLPDKFKVPHIKMDDGLRDPKEHLKTYNAYLMLHGTADEIAYHAFLMWIFWINNKRPLAMGRILIG
jgi:hypothetical protein